MFVFTIIAIIIANSPFNTVYTTILNAHFLTSLGHINLEHIINDGLMTLFFLLVSMEVKRELLIGHINSIKKALLPCIAALGGIIFPAIIYLLLNRNSVDTQEGWAIPTATDIAFSLAILMLLGKRVPPALKTFLTTLAIIDDVGAIVIITFFYTAQLKIIFLLLAALCFLILILFNRMGVHRIFPYVTVGLLLWICVYESSIHATIAGVLLGFTIPLHPNKVSSYSPLKKLERVLSPWVAFGILPLFALANAGLSFSGIDTSVLLHPLTLGIGLGLFLGKQLGILTVCWVAVKAKLAKLPVGIHWSHLYGVSILAGVGFTMSLFIGTLAFAEDQPGYMNWVKLGVIIGSLLSGIIGYFMLRIAYKQPHNSQKALF